MPGPALSLLLAASLVAAPDPATESTEALLAAAALASPRSEECLRAIDELAIRDSPRASKLLLRLSRDRSELVSTRAMGSLVRRLQRVEPTARKAAITQAAASRRRGEGRSVPAAAARAWFDNTWRAHLESGGLPPGAYDTPAALVADFRQAHEPEYPWLSLPQRRALRKTLAAAEAEARMRTRARTIQTLRHRGDAQGDNHKQAAEDPRASYMAFDEARQAEARGEKPKAGQTKEALFRKFKAAKYRSLESGTTK